MSVTKKAKPCVKCHKYYPGDCLEDGCRDFLCTCDGCEAYHIMIQGEDLE